jgi:hypothetical protein
MNKLPIADWADVRTQLVYELICECEESPDGEHWEGYLARRIVGTLDAAQSRGFGEIIGGRKMSKARAIGCKYCEGAGPEPGFLWTENNGPIVTCPLCNDIGPDLDRNQPLHREQNKPFTRKSGEKQS